MRLTNTLLLAAAGLSLAACSNDDSTPDKVPSDEAIVFNASAPKAPRSVITTENLNNFRVTAFVGGEKYMSNVMVTKDGANWTYSPTMYWPVDKTVNFFSYAPGENSSDAPTIPAAEGNADIKGFVNTGATDLLYGVNMNESGATTNTVKINFRHALSQVRFTFKRKTETPAIRVDVVGVNLVDIKSTGDFQFPRETTTQDSETGFGAWSNQATPENPVIYANENGQTVTLTDTPQELLSSSYIFAVPQTLVPSEIRGTRRTGSFVRVLCSIYDDATGVKIWPKKGSVNDYDDETNCGYLYFPLDAGGSEGTTKQWDPGRAYVYNITIGIPESASAIQFDVTVDNYKDFANIEL